MVWRADGHPGGRVRLAQWAGTWTARLCSLPVWFQEAARSAWAGRNVAYACTSLAMARSRGLAIALGSRPVFYSRVLPLRAAHVAGWGRKWSGRRAQQIAARSGARLCLIEDGFLRSVRRSAASLSYVIDNRGIHYDAREPSLFEDLARQSLTAAATQRTDQIIRLWRDLGVSKYNGLRDATEPVGRPYVLVADQTLGDASVAGGLADAQSFQDMLAAALHDNPDHLVVVKTHPDSHSRAARGYFDIPRLQAHHRIRTVTAPCHPAALIRGADAVYTVTSQIGFEALIWNKPVHTFGMPFYAGWGLTEDRLASPARRRPIRLDQLVHAALVGYPRYIDPLSGTPCEVERCLAHVGLQRRHRTALPPVIHARGFSRWKRSFMTTFLQGSQVDFSKWGLLHGAVAVWGSNEAPAATTVLRIEDGFLRSSGLGADLVRPLSLVIDDVGIYYDATRPSRLEQILATTVLSAADHDRARNLRTKLVAQDVTKYNLGHARWERPRTDRAVLLVVGQVESDAAIALGSPVIRTNIALLQRVRAENPEAYIVYKPHPDVLARLRHAGAGEDAAFKIADEVLTTQVSLNDLLGGVDTVHVMTSLLGFEAVIRGKTVVCHGLPFYAGWGLTQDRLTCPRRMRALSCDDLVHAALIAYPRYVNHDQRCFVTPEEAVDMLVAQSAQGPATRRWHRRLLRAGIVGWRAVSGAGR